MSTVPTAMIFDDHDVRDDWNTSAAWRDEMRGDAVVARPDPVGAGVVLGLPAHRQPRPRRARRRPRLPAGHRRTAATPGRCSWSWPTAPTPRPTARKGVRFSFRWDLGRSRLVMIDSRNGRILDDGHHLMLGDARVRLGRGAGAAPGRGRPPGAGHVGAVAAAARDRRPARPSTRSPRPGPGWRGRLGEKIRQAADLEHWAAFRESFDRLTAMIERRGRRAAPATVSVLSGDVHHSYAARADLPSRRPGRGAPADLLAGAQPDRAGSSSPGSGSAGRGPCGALTRAPGRAGPGAPPKPLSLGADRRAAVRQHHRHPATSTAAAPRCSSSSRVTAATPDRRARLELTLMSTPVGRRDRRPDRRAAADHGRARAGVPGDPAAPGDRQVVGRLRPGAGAPRAARPARLRDRAGGEVVGLIIYREEHDPDHRHAGVDLALHPDHQGQGLGCGRDAGDGPLPVRRRDHHRVAIDPGAHNARAIRSCQRAGFRPVGVLRRYERAADGSWHDGLLMDLLAEDLRLDAQARCPTRGLRTPVRSNQVADPRRRRAPPPGGPRRGSGAAGRAADRPRRRGRPTSPLTCPCSHAQRAVVGAGAPSTRPPDPRPSSVACRCSVDPRASSGVRAGGARGEQVEPLRRPRRPRRGGRARSARRARARRRPSATVDSCSRRRTHQPPGAGRGRSTPGLRSGRHRVEQQPGARRAASRATSGRRRLAVGARSRISTGRCRAESATAWRRAQRWPRPVILAMPRIVQPGTARDRCVGSAWRPARRAACCRRRAQRVRRETRRRHRCCEDASARPARRPCMSPGLVQPRRPPCRRLRPDDVQTGTSVPVPATASTSSRGLSVVRASAPLASAAARGPAPRACRRDRRPAPARSWRSTDRLGRRGPPALQVPPRAGGHGVAGSAAATSSPSMRF